MTTIDKATAGMSPEAREGEATAWWVIFLLGLMYVLSFVDRSILGLLVAPLKADLHISDIDVGLLIGPAFGVFYAILGLPVARLADRANRVLIVIVGVLLWGAATIGSAFAATFGLLLALRVGLAVGEAVLTPSAYSLIADLFRPTRRAFASSLYSATGMAGASIAYVAGALVVGYVAKLEASGHHLPLATWRIVLIFVGAPSIVVALLFALSVREPKRRGGPVAPSVGQVWSYLRQHISLFGPLFLGAGLMQAIIYANNSWGPEFLRRQFHLPPQSAGLMLGLAGLIGAFGGSVTMPAICRALARRGRRDAVAVTTMGGLAIGACAVSAAPLQSSPLAFAVLSGIGTFFMVGGTINVQVSLQHLVPIRMRGTFVGLLLMCISLLGLGIGPTLAAAISTHLAADGHRLGSALAMLGPIIAIPAFLLLAASRRALSAFASAETDPF
jgi:MFS family permease